MHSTAFKIASGARCLNSQNESQKQSDAFEHKPNDFAVESGIACDLHYNIWRRITFDSIEYNQRQLIQRTEQLGLSCRTKEGKRSSLKESQSD
jgi:hypothetical protein